MPNDTYRLDAESLAQMDESLTRLEADVASCRGLSQEAIDLLGELLEKLDAADEAWVELMDTRTPVEPTIVTSETLDRYRSEVHDYVAFNDASAAHLEASRNLTERVGRLVTDEIEALRSKRRS